MKLKKPAGETLILFSEKTSLQFVLGQGPSASYDNLLFILTFARSVRAVIEAKGTQGLGRCRGVD